MTGDGRASIASLRRRKAAHASGVRRSPSPLRGGLTGTEGCWRWQNGPASKRASKGMVGGRPLLPRTTPCAPGLGGSGVRGEGGVGGCVGDLALCSAQWEGHWDD